MQSIKIENNLTESIAETYMVMGEQYCLKKRFAVGEGNNDKDVKHLMWLEEALGRATCENREEIEKAIKSITCKYA